MPAGSEQLLSQLTSSAVVIYAIEALKRSRLAPWISAETKTLNRWLAVVGSGVSALGIHFFYDSTAGRLIIDGLTLAGVAHGLWHWLQQYAITQLAYDSAVDKRTIVALPPEPEKPGLIAKIESRP